MPESWLAGTLGDREVAAVGHVEVAHISFTLPNGRVLLDDVSFRVGEGVTAALVGPNGAGKTTLLRLISGDLPVQTGTVGRSGGLGVMPQFIGGLRAAGVRGAAGADGGLPGEQSVGNIRDESTVRDLLMSTAPPRVQAAGKRLDSAELAMMESDEEPVAMAYAAALTAWGDAGGYQAEVLWDACCTAALGMPYERCRWRETSTLSGGEQKRLVLEALLRGPDEVLLLDEPDNYLDVPGKRWLEEQLAATQKTVLLVSHDRELLANSAERIITVESSGTWVHGGGFASYAQARRDRIDRLDELRRRWDEEHAKLKALVAAMRQKASYNSGMASRLHAARNTAAQVRGGRTAGSSATGAERSYAPSRRAHRKAGRYL